MRVLFVGYLSRGQPSGMRCAALRRLGHDVVAVDAGTIWRGAGYLSRQLGQMNMRGRRIERLNAAVLEHSSVNSRAGVGGETGVSPSLNARAIARRGRFDTSLQSRPILFTSLEAYAAR